MTTCLFHGHLTPQDKADSDYYYLPFDVPEGITGIGVEYDFTRTGHAARKAGHDNVIDIGLFDPRGHGPNADGFRGWSGSDRAGFTVGLTEATPGYLPGPIPSGTWHIILGLYKIAPQGCDYRVTVSLTRGTQPPQQANHAGIPSTAQTGVVRRGPGWYRGDLHIHTHHSDAGASVAEMAEAAKARGLDFMAVMDHNTVSHFPELRALSGPHLLLIPGTELTTYYGHANAWGLSRWVDFRGRDVEAMERIMAAVGAQGALFSINHPHSVLAGVWEYGWLEGCHILEVWNAVWMHSNYAALTWWDRLLQEGRRIVAVGGSDRHQPREFDPHWPHQVGTPTTWIYAQELSVDAILAGVQAGHVFITADVDAPQVYLTASADDGQTAIMGDLLEVPDGTSVVVECQVYGGGGEILEFLQDGRVVERRRIEGGRAHVTWRAAGVRDGYIRAQAVASPPEGLPEPAYPKLLAVTNPIYLRPG